MFNERDEIKEKRLQHQLEVQSMQIERVFNRHQVKAHVAGGTVKPRLISFDLHTQLATGLERLKGLTDDLMQTLGVPVSFSREGEQFRLHVSQPDGVPVSLLDLMGLLVDLPPITAVLGLAEDSRPVLLDFGEQGMTHILLSGVSGAGKTALLRSMALSLALLNRQSRIQFVVMDSHEGEMGDASLQALNYLPHLLANVISHPDDMRETVSFLMSEVSYRLEYEVKAPTIVVMVDEVVALLEKGEAEVRDAIRYLAQRGAEVGVHLVMSTQQPESAVLDRLLKANVSVQIVGRLADREQALKVTGQQGSQAEHLLGQGDFLAISGPYMTHFQAAYIGDYDLHMTLQELHRKRPPALLAQTADAFNAISLAAEEENEEDEFLPHFIFTGNAVSFHDDDFRGAALAVEIEEAEEEDEPFAVPQPVIRLFDEAMEVGVEEAEEYEDDEVAETADSLYIFPLYDDSPPDRGQLYHTISQASYPYTFHSDTIFASSEPEEFFFAEEPLAEFDEVSEEAELAFAEQPPIGATELDTMDAEDAEDAEDVVDVVEDEGDVDFITAVEDSGEPEEADEAEYEAFEDDWLPFDDE